MLKWSQVSSCGGNSKCWQDCFHSLLGNAAVHTSGCSLLCCNYALRLVHVVWQGETIDTWLCALPRGFSSLCVSNDWTFVYIMLRHYMHLNCLRIPHHCWILLGKAANHFFCGNLKVLSLCLEFFVTKMEVAAVPCALGSLICLGAKMSVFFSNSTVCTQNNKPKTDLGLSYFSSFCRIEQRGSHNVENCLKDVVNLLSFPSCCRECQNTKYIMPPGLQDFFFLWVFML